MFQLAKGISRNLRSKRQERDGRLPKLQRVTRQKVAQDCLRGYKYNKCLGPVILLVSVHAKLGSHLPVSYITHKTTDHNALVNTTQ